MRLDVTVQQKRPGVDDLVPDGQPRGSIEPGQEIIPIPWVVEVEAARLDFDGLVNRGPIPLPRVAADDVRFVAMFVHRVRELNRFGRGPTDLEDEIDPGAVLGGESEIGVFGFVGVEIPE